MSNDNYVAMASLRAQLQLAHEAINAIWKAHMIAVSNGGGAWKRHVEPAIYDAAKLLPAEMRKDRLFEMSKDRLFEKPADEIEDLLG